MSLSNGHDCAACATREKHINKLKQEIERWKSRATTYKNQAEKLRRGTRGEAMSRNAFSACERDYNEAEERRDQAKAERIQHTPEPWSLGFYTALEFPFNICAPDGRVLATVKGEQDRRRIVTCVNACAGISTDSLETFIKIGEVNPAYDILKQQRDELLAALRQIAYNVYLYHKDTIREIAAEACAKVQP